MGTFPIDHIVPRSDGGKHDPENLALACQHCNQTKADNSTGLDPVTGATVGLFHPRLQDWERHFEWSVELLGVLIGRTPVGRATIATLQLNEAAALGVRRVLMEVGLFDPVTV
jgi:hypothetical protein